MSESIKCRIEADMPPKIDRTLKCGSRTLVVANSGSKLVKAKDHYLRNVAKLLELFTTPFQAMTIMEFDPQIFSILPGVFSEHEFIVVVDVPTSIACVGRKTSVQSIEVLESFNHTDGYVKNAGDGSNEPTYSPRHTGIVVFKVTYNFGDSIVIGGIHFHHMTAKSWYSKMPAVHAGTSFKTSFHDIFDKLAQLTTVHEMKILLGDFNRSLTKVSAELQKRGVSALLRAFAPRPVEDTAEGDCFARNDAPVISMTETMQNESDDFDCLAAFSLIPCTTSLSGPQGAGPTYNRVANTSHMCGAGSFSQTWRNAGGETHTPVHFNWGGPPIRSDPNRNKEIWANKRAVRGNYALPFPKRAELEAIRLRELALHGPPKRPHDTRIANLRANLE
jgi:hypothetical protein